ncbi:MAG: cbb3-type cytochrome c oxidase N-terminal domain-containing protein, partial [candidate division NC10 bacterium]
MDTTDRDRLLDHEYDGIEEYDNPLPGWWVWVFWATIVFSGVYVAFYHVGPGPSVIGQYEEDVRLAAE